MERRASGIQDHERERRQPHDVEIIRLHGGEKEFGYQHDRDARQKRGLPTLPLCFERKEICGHEQEYDGQHDRQGRRGHLEVEVSSRNHCNEVLMRGTLYRAPVCPFPLWSGRNCPRSPVAPAPGCPSRDITHGAGVVIPHRCSEEGRGEKHEEYQPNHQAADSFHLRKTSRAGA